MYVCCMQEKDGNTVLHVAVAAHRSEAVRILLEAGATPTVPNHSHLTPILAAATTGFYLYIGHTTIPLAHNSMCFVK